MERVELFFRNTIGDKNYLENIFHHQKISYLKKNNEKLRSPELFVFTC